MSRTKRFYGSYIKTLIPVNELHDHVLQRLKSHPELRSGSQPHINRIAEIDHGNERDIRYITFLLGIPVKNKQIDFIDKKLIDLGWQKSFKPVRIIVFPDRKYLIFIHEYYDTPDKLLARIGEVFNLESSTLFGKERIDLFLDRDISIFLKKYSNLKRIYSVTFRVKTIDNFGLNSWRRELDELKADTGAGEYSVEYKRSQQQRIGGQALSTESDEFKTFLKDSLASNQMDVTIRGTSDQGLLEHLKSEEELRSEEIPDKMTFIENLPTLITKAISTLHEWLT